METENRSTADGEHREWRGVLIGMFKYLDRLVLIEIAYASPRFAFRWILRFL
jgi:hypothetical protein